MRRRITAGLFEVALLFTQVACGSPTAVASPAVSESPVAVPASVDTAIASAAPSGSPAFGHGSVIIRTKTGAVSLSVEIADSDAKHEYGLMNRRALAPDAGMLFVFQPPASAQRVGFWMKDTLIPLSIAFVDPNLTIESLDEMQPQNEDVHYAPRDYAYAIEANKGFFSMHGVAPGDQVSIQQASTTP